MDPREQYIPGLEDVIATKTNISILDVDREQIVIRGYSLIDLAQKATYLDVAYLLLYGALPTTEQKVRFENELKKEMDIDEDVYKMFSLLPKVTSGMDILRTGLSFISGYEDPDLLLDNSSEANLKKGIKILAKAPTICANGYRAAKGLPFVKPKKELGFTENFLYMMLGKETDAETKRVFDMVMTCYIEHELPNSTFTARVVASTLSDIYGALVSAVASLKGALHGGANEACVYMMLELLKKGGSEKAEQLVMDKLKNKEKIMGFGHRVYMKKYDPRAFLLKDYIPNLVKRHKDGEELYKIYQIIEKVVNREKGLFPNTDYPIGLILYLLGVPIDLFTPIFLCSRNAGAGKGTQAQIIAKEHKVAHISTGDMLREEIKLNTELGKLAKAIIDRGELVSDDIIMNMIENLFKSDKIKNGFIFDGFPRTLVQAKELDSMLHKLNLKIESVINLIVEPEEVVKRISGRKTCAKCGAVYNVYLAPPKKKDVCDTCQGTEFKQRPDDNEATVRSRLSIYQQQTSPVLEYYQSQNLVRNIDATQAIEKITKQIMYLF
ncbi:hypothetical protein CHS0354_000732 [Potamilus streckersoni]|uniref:Citrate synthase n=1 Tax=Potamilus streckersoni TaxID=2493646 RepID=A0AAE0T7G7_9BIVA|nr:hypothetical protein CHS0354_000732 [Potamilus streckersoni]